jgi:hypothetical protein
MDKPKLKIILYRISQVVVIIWLLAVGICEYRIDNRIEAIVLPVIALVAIWQTIRSWHKPNWGGLPAAAIWMLYTSFFYLPRDYTKHQNKLRLDKFGPVLNARRIKLGIPVIPANWQPDFYGDRDVTWSKKDSAAGHQSKDIFLDSLHRLRFEDDTYNLKRADSVDRNLNIRTYFSKSGSVDSTDYTYEAGMNNKTISRSQADSIFKAEKIGKDY